MAWPLLPPRPPRGAAAPPDGWRALADGREGLFRGGERVAVVAHRPGVPHPFETESTSLSGATSLRNLDTRADAIAHCERHADSGSAAW